MEIVELDEEWKLITDSECELIKKNGLGNKFYIHVGFDKPNQDCEEFLLDRRYNFDCNGNIYCKKKKSVLGSGNFSILVTYKQSNVKTPNETNEEMNIFTVPAYSNEDKRQRWTVSRSEGIFQIKTPTRGQYLIDGRLTGTVYFAKTVVKEHFIEVEFSKPKIVHELKWTQNRTSNNGKWKLQGYKDDAWVDISDVFNIGVEKVTLVDTLDKKSEFKKVRMLGVSGSASYMARSLELNFKVSERALVVL